MCDNGFDFYCQEGDIPPGNWPNSGTGNNLNTVNVCTYEGMDVFGPWPIEGIDYNDCLTPTPPHIIT